MADKHKLIVRTTVMTEIAEFTLGADEELDVRVVGEIGKANVEGRLTRMATAVGLPAVMVSVMGEGENLTGGENAVSHALYGPDGTPLATRSYRIDPTEEGHFVVVALDEDQPEVMVGAFVKEGVAQTVGMLWRNGHLHL